LLINHFICINFVVVIRTAWQLKAASVIVIITNLCIVFLVWWCRECRLTLSSTRTAGRWDKVLVPNRIQFDAYERWSTKSLRTRYVN